MHPRQPLPTSLLRLALFQDGVVTTAQARSAGMTRHVLARCLTDGSLGALTRGVYTIGAAPPSFDGLAWAGCLIGGEGSRIGGAAAVRLLGLTDDVPDVVDVLVPPGVNASRDDPRWRFVRDRPATARWASRGSPPRISVEDAVLDLCASGAEAEVVGWVTTAVQRRLTTPRRLRRRVDQRPRVRHRRLLLHLLTDVAAGAESPLEVGYLNDVERAHGLPCGARQLSSGTPAVTDVDYRPYALLVELDGRLGHEGSGRFRDMSRDNAHVVLGRPTLRYGHADVFTQPCAVAWQVADVLVRCGWSGLPTHCSRCTGLGFGSV